jgi:hypothetical protein
LVLRGYRYVVRCPGLHLRHGCCAQVSRVDRSREVRVPVNQLRHVCHVSGVPDAQMGMLMVHDEGLVRVPQVEAGVNVSLIWVWR